MPDRYLLPCPNCSQKLTVSLVQAGEHVACECGTNVDVPTMRELRMLSPAEDNLEPQKTGWNTRRGWLFVIGVMFILFAGLAHWQINPMRKRLDIQAPQYEELNVDLDKISLRQAWMTWKQFRGVNLDFRNTPEFIANQKRHRELSYFIYTSWSIAVIGVGLLVGALCWPTP